MSLWKIFMTIQLKTALQWHHQIFAKMMEWWDFEDFQKLTYFSTHEDNFQSWQILARSKTVPKWVCKKLWQYNKRQYNSDVIIF